MSAQGPFYMANKFLPFSQLSASSNFTLGKLALSDSFGLQWYLNDTHIDKKRKLYTTYQDRPYCLDVSNQNTFWAFPYLATCSDSSLGPLWGITPGGPVPSEDSAFSKFSNALIGDGVGWFLDTYGDGAHEAFMSQGDFTGQYWYTYPINATDEGLPAQNNGTSTSMSVSSNSTSASNSTTAAAAQSASQSQNQTQIHSSSVTSATASATSADTGKATASTKASAATKAGCGLGFAYVALFVSGVYLSA